MKPTLILLPGLVCDAAVWAPQIQALSLQAHCHVPDYGLRDSLADMAQHVRTDDGDRRRGIRRGQTGHAGAGDDDGFGLSHRDLLGEGRTGDESQESCAGERATADNRFGNRHDNNPAGNEQSLCSASNL